MSTIEISFSKKSAFYIFQGFVCIAFKDNWVERRKKYSEINEEIATLRPLHTTQETAKNAVIFHTHYNLFLTIAKFFQQVYI